jgi:16S rRNA (uracil1498-N3)-methyltransferase
MHRFFLPADWIAEGTAVITGKLVHQIRNVLRLGTGDHIAVLDNSGWEYEVELQKLDSARVEGKVVRKSPAVTEPKTKITLYQALLKGSNFEFVLQKCTEVGVAGFAPLICERCVAGEPDSKRLSRWRSIITEAAELSGRGKLPVLQNPTSFTEACKSASGISLIPWEEEKARGIGNVLRSHRKIRNDSAINIFIGPEGGFSPHEVEFARSCGIVTVSLGHRILRAETAGLVAATITLYEFGELTTAR